MRHSKRSFYRTKKNGSHEENRRIWERLISSYFKPPDGWPEKSPILKSSINSYRVLWLCDQHLTPKYRHYIEEAQQTKQVYHLKSVQQISQFFESIGNQEQG